MRLLTSIIILNNVKVQKRFTDVYLVMYEKNLLVKRKLETLNSQMKSEIKKLTKLTMEMIIVMLTW